MAAVQDDAAPLPSLSWVFDRSFSPLHRHWDREGTEPDMTRELRSNVILRQYLSACESLDVARIVDCFSQTAVIRDPANERISGREAIHRYFTRIYMDLSSLSFLCSPVYWCGNSASVRWEGRGSRKDGTSVSYEGIDVFTFGGSGSIDEMWAFWTPEDLVVL